MVSIARAVADTTISSSSVQAVYAGGEAEEMAASSTSTSRDHGPTTSLVSNKKHSVSVEIGASVMHFVRGEGGSSQKSIEDNFGVKLIFPSSKRDDSIVIEGTSLDIINKASEKIQEIIDKAVQSPSLDYSHFISIPLSIYPELSDKLLKFQSTILGDIDPMDVAGTSGGVVNAEKDRKSRTLSELGIDKSIFINPKTFHLTILMLKLWNKERVRAATEVLQTISPKLTEVLENRPLVLRLKGLDLMRGTRAKAYVLYAPVEEIGNEGRLLRACKVIKDAYVEAGLVLEKDIGHKLKLHATLMNTSSRKMPYRKGKRISIPFDATKIFWQFGSEHWGDYHIKEAHLSQRFLYDQNGYYHCCASIPFPDKPSN